MSATEVQVGQVVGWLREGRVGRALVGRVVEVSGRYATVIVEGVESWRYDRREIGRRWLVTHEQLQPAG